MYDPRFEWAYGSPTSTVFTCTMRLPTLSEAQELLDSVTLTEQDLVVFRDELEDEWRRGAVTSYFARNLEMGRLIKSVKETVAEENFITCWCVNSSKLHKTFEAQTVDPVNRARVFEHVYNTLRATCELRSDRRGALPDRRDSVTSDAI